MNQHKIPLSSDNWTPEHIIKAIVDTNNGNAPSYGLDPWTEEAQDLIQETFKRK